MDDIIALLQERAETVPVPLELPDEDALLDVEAELNLRLPASLREFLASVSDLVIGRLEPATAADPASHTYLPALLEEARGDGVPRRLLPFCRIAEGSYACLTTEETVVYWPDEDKEYESIWEWAESEWR